MNRLLVALVVFVLFSCSRQESILSSFPTPSDIVGEEIQLDLSSVAFPNYKLFKISDYLIFADSKSDFWIKVIDLHYPEKVFGLGRKGRGPGEITFIYNLDKYPGLKNGFFINDAPKKQILIYCVDSIISGKRGPEIRIKTSEQSMMKNIHPLHKGRFIGENLVSRNYYLALYDKEFDVLSEELRYPDEMLIQLDMLNTSSMTSAFYPLLCFNPEKPTFCAILQNSDFFEIISLSSDTLKSVFRSYTYLPEVRAISSFRYTYSDIRGGIINACSSKKYIYCLAHDDMEKLTMDDIGKGQRNIFIFNWDGSPERAIRLDRNISLFTVDENDSALYAFTYGEEDLKLLKYDLKNQQGGD